MRRTRIYNEATGRWEWWTVEETPLRPWRFVRLETLLALRGLRKVLRGTRPRRPQEYVFDEAELRMRRPKWKGGRAFLKISEAVISMVEMQKFIG